jgi:hypothetical protein
MKQRQPPLFCCLHPSLQAFPGIPVISAFILRLHQRLCGGTFFEVSAVFFSQPVFMEDLSDVHAVKRLSGNSFMHSMPFEINATEAGALRIIFFEMLTRVVQYPAACAATQAKGFMLFYASFSVFLVVHGLSGFFYQAY